MTAEKKAKAGVKKVQKQKVKPAAEAPASVALVRRGAELKMPVKIMGTEARIDVIRGWVDSLEAVQFQFATGAVLVGMELLALKQEVGRGEFMKIFAERIERPRFSYRTSAKYMQAAESVRVKMLKSGVKNLAEIWDVAPSALSMERRRELQNAVGSVLNGATLSQLLLGKGSKGGAGASGKVPTSAEAMMAAQKEIYAALAARIVADVVEKKTWKMLDPEDVAKVRQALESALDALPAKD